MDTILSYIEENAEWIFSGAGGVAILSIAGYFREKISSLFLNLRNRKFLKTKDESFQKNSSDKNHTKSRTNILFIDDEHTKFRVVSILKSAGWINTDSIEDVTDVDDKHIIWADIIFVDINGVGTTLFQDQGLGLASSLKKRYPDKKIILYSAESSGDLFNKAIREVDGCLPKNAEPYQFINLVEELV